MSGGRHGGTLALALTGLGSCPSQAVGHSVEGLWPPSVAFGWLNAALPSLQFGLHVYFSAGMSGFIVSTIRQQPREIDGKRSINHILGLSHSHDSGAVLLRDGVVVAAVNEERLSRQKHDGAFPRRSIEWLLDFSGLDPKDIDLVAVAGRHLASYPALNNDLSEDDGSYRPAVAVAEALDRVPGVGGLLMSRPTTRLYRAAQSLAGRLMAGRVTEALNVLGIAAPVDFYDHHDCHLAGAYYTSEQDNCLLFSNDGFGDGLCAKVAIGRNGRLEPISSNSFYNSLGILYGYATDICGFPRIWHAGKTTGLAARGDWQRTYPIFAQAMTWNERLGRYESRIGLFRNAQRWLRQRLAGVSREDVAAGIQRLTEALLVDQLRWYRQRTGLDRVAVAGGVHANVRANQAMADEAGLKSFYVFPNMGDGGLALGAAYLARSTQGDRRAAPQRLSSLYLGPQWSEQELVDILAARGVAYERPAQLPRRVAELLAEGKIIARFDGRMEYGPRALGNRSILYRATDPTANDWLNTQLGRSEFMPFAPVLRDIDAARLIEGYGPTTSYTSKFMTITFRATDVCRQEAPACVHVDGTMRPQVIERADNPAYYDILSEYHALTGHSVLVNTSFNMHEEPIVCSPEDALRAFEAGNLDYLVLGPFLVPRLPGSRQ
jgi:carbamoyltransferase